jgi:psp operon transcriptional activator
LRNAVERSVSRTDPDAVVDTVVLDPFASPWRPVTAPAAPAVPTDAGPDRDANGAGTAPGGFLDRVGRFEAELLEQALRRCGFSQKRAAASLGLSYHQFRGYLRKHGLPPRPRNVSEPDRSATLAAKSPL